MAVTFHFTAGESGHSHNPDDIVIGNYNPEGKWVELSKKDPFYDQLVEYVRRNYARQENQDPS